VNTVIVALDALIGILRPVFFAGGVVLAALAGLSYAVRTRRINPFSSVARVTRGSIDPLFAPVERRVVRAGGHPTTVPWWALAAFVVAGIVLLNVLGFVEAQLAGAASAAALGTAGLVRLLVSWTFGLLQIALFVRVAASWFRTDPRAPWLRWSYALTEWIMRPLRQIVPPLGMVDVTPIVAYLVLAYLLQPMVMSVLPR
jgi:YggT family protein